MVEIPLRGRGFYVVRPLNRRFDRDVVDPGFVLASLSRELRTVPLPDLRLVVLAAPQHVRSWILRAPHSAFLPDTPPSGAHLSELLHEASHVPPPVGRLRTQYADT